MTVEDKAKITRKITKLYNQKLYPKLKHRRGFTRIKETLEKIQIHLMMDNKHPPTIKTEKGKIRFQSKNDLKYFIREEPFVEYFREEIRNNHKCFADIGSYHGFYTLLAQQYINEIHSFEPNPYNFQKLSENILLNDAEDKITRWGSPLMDRDYGRIFIELENEGASRVKGESKKEVDKTGLSYGYEFPVKAYTFDQIFIEEKGDVVEMPSLVKIDVEGAELKVLEGMENFIEQYHPVIMLELHTELIERFYDTEGELFNFIAECGYDSVWAWYKTDKRLMLVFKEAEE